MTSRLSRPVGITMNDIVREAIRTTAIAYWKTNSVGRYLVFPNCVTNLSNS
jgi:hypothetical protein